MSLYSKEEVARTNISQKKKIYKRNRVFLVKPFREQPSPRKILWGLNLNCLREK